MMKYLFLIILLIYPIKGFSQEKKVNKGELQLTVGYNSFHLFEIEPAYSYMFNRYVGATIGANLMLQSASFRNMVINSLSDERVEIEDEEIPEVVLLRPAVRFQIPLFKEESEHSFVLNIEPGLFINPFPNETSTVRTEQGFETTVTNKNGQWLYAHLKAYALFDLGECYLSLGYAFSNFDVYNSRRNIILDGKPLYNFSRQMTHSFFLNAGYYF